MGFHSVRLKYGTLQNQKVMRLPCAIMFASFHKLRTRESHTFLPCKVIYYFLGHSVRKTQFWALVHFFFCSFCLKNIVCYWIKKNLWRRKCVRRTIFWNVDTLFATRPTVSLCNLSGVILHQK